jgi:molecular chaperone GrpE
MRYRDERPEDGTAAGAPGSEDAYARGAGAADETIAAPGEGRSADDESTRASDAGDDASADAELRRQLDEQREKHLRLAADYDNFRKRSAKERAEAGSRGQAELVKRILDSLDDLARVSDLDPATTDAGAVVEGVELVERKLQKELGALGLQMVDPVDQPFDPAVMEAVATEPALSREDDHMVARVYQRGYTFNGQLLRPARVVVKQWNG